MFILFWNRDLSKPKLEVVFDSRTLRTMQTILIDVSSFIIFHTLENNDVTFILVKSTFYLKSFRFSALFAYFFDFFSGQIWFRQAEKITVKRRVEVRDNVTIVAVKPRSSIMMIIVDTPYIVKHRRAADTATVGQRLPRVIRLFRVSSMR